MTKGLLEGKRGVIIGIANDRSLAWGIAKVLHQHGAEIALNYPNDKFFKKIEPLAAEVKAPILAYCDVTDDASIEALFEEIKQKWGSIDFLVHAVAYSDKEELRGRYIDSSRENFLNSMDISCYSFVKLANRAEKIMNSGGSLLTLTYYGAEKVMPNYNVMGVVKAALEASVRYMAADLGKKDIRVNAISAGPVRTLASSAIGDFHYILKWNEYNAPLRRNTTLEDVGLAALGLVIGKGITGEVLHVDSGYHVVGMKDAEAPDIATVIKSE